MITIYEPCRKRDHPDCVGSLDGFLEGVAPDCECRCHVDGEDTMNECKHNNVHIDAIVTLYADRPRADGSYVLGISGELHEAVVQIVICADCQEEVYASDDTTRPEGYASVEIWLRDFYGEFRSARPVVFGGE